MITKRGVKVYPHGIKETYCTDHWRCRCVGIDAKLNTSTPDYTSLNYEDVVGLIIKLKHRKF